VIESLLGQDFDDPAIVALDDGSDDGTVAVARRYAAQDSYLPVSVQHAGWLAERLVVGHRRPDGIDRAEGAAIAGRYLARWVTRIDLEPRAAPLRRRLGIETKRLQRRRKDMRKTARAFRRALRAAVRGAVLAAPAGERAYRRLRNRS
jgi:glycosyltransferase involved in cell wall biosynthesis